MRTTWQVSIRRACTLLTAGRSTYHYRCRRASHGVLKKRIREIAETRVRSIVDAFSRLSPAVDVRRSYRGSDVVVTLERIIRPHDRPTTIRVEHGPELISKEFRNLVI